MVTVSQALRSSAAKLRAISPTPLLDAEVLLRHALGWTREELYSKTGSCVPHDTLLHYYELVDQRMSGKPVAYITGHKEFFGLDLLVDERVLIPRPETEALVEAALIHLMGKCRENPCSAADVGTGSGAIALALLANLSNLKVYGIDISGEALEVAKTNCHRLNLCHRLTLLQGDLLQPLPEPVDAIIANLPYAAIGEVDVDVDQWEPALALYAPEGGMGLIARLIEQVPGKLKDGGFIALEIHPPRIGQILNLAKQRLRLTCSQVVKDLAGNDRVVILYPEGPETTPPA